MKRKIFTRLSLLTLLAFLFVSLMLITKSPAHPDPTSCHIWPNSPSAKEEHCKNCPPTVEGDHEAHCDKNDCACAEERCAEWIQTPDMCSDIHVCGAVCNNRTAAPSCYITTHSPAISGTGEPITCVGVCPIGETCGTVPPGGYCNYDYECAWDNLCDNNHFCEYSGPGGNCTIDYLTKLTTPGLKINHQTIWRKNPVTSVSGDSDCYQDYICCQDDAALEAGKIPIYRGYCIAPGDFNRDCTINIVDIATVAVNFGCSVEAGGSNRCPEFTHGVSGYPISG